MNPTLQTPFSARFPIRPPASEFLYEAVVDVGPSRSMGRGPLGERRIVPILGGSFEGPRLRGKVLPGGADRQLWRADGMRELDALYELETDDGVLLTVHNRVLIDAPEGGPRYAHSHVSLSAPDGAHGWLNRLRCVGTLDSLSPGRAAVVVRVFRLVDGVAAV